MTDRLFGRRLTVDLAALRAAMAGTPISLATLAHRHQIRARLLQKLELGDWGEFPHHALFFLTALAEELEVPSLIHTEGTRMWQSFRQQRTGNLVVVGSNRDGQAIKGDHQCAEQLVASDIGFEVRQVTDSEGVRYGGFLGRRNVVTLGGAKVNRVTERALERLGAMPGAPKIAFLWPGFDRASPVAERAPGREKGVRINGKEYLEDEPGRMLGIVAACIENVNGESPSREVTTVVISGCSRHATAELTRALRDPRFNALSHSQMDRPTGSPAYFLYDSADRLKPWRVLNPRDGRNSRGRPPGSRTGRS